MACRGVHFALTEGDVKTLKSFEDDSDRRDYLHEEIEETYFAQQPERIAETDKAWDAIHRCLGDGTLGYENGSFPLSHVILGGEPLYAQDDYIIVVKTPEQVRAIARHIGSITEAFMRERYFALDSDDYGVPLTEEDCQYTWDWFSGLILFYERAASEGRYVLFSVDQ